MTAYRCVAGPRCIRADERQGAATDRRDTLCPPCRTRIENAVHQLPEDWADLGAALGERTANSGQRISSTPTAAVPISTRKEALMRAIVDMADRAAAAISSKLKTGQPATYKGRGYPEHGQHVLKASIAMVEPNIDTLTLTAAEPHVVWARPHRCDTHLRLIAAAEAQLAAAAAAERDAAENTLRTVYALAGHCEACNGWGEHGQERQLVELTGLDIALELVDLHNQTRAELGLTRLRHEYEMPCPDCGAKVYRNDGESIVQCEGDSRHTCTEREYKVRAGLRLEERTWTDMQKYLLAESYWRLDRVQTVVDLLTDNPVIDEPGAGSIILEKLVEILAAGAQVNDKPIGHQRPNKRASGTDKRAALQRQVDEDNWTWRNEKPYQKPKPKKKPEPKPVKHPIAASSRSLLTDIDEDAAVRRR